MSQTTPNPYEEHAQRKRDIAQAQQEILAALQLAWPSFYQDPMKEEVGSHTSHQLSRHQIDMGVRALMLACNLRGGSTGDMNIYRLMHVYFWDEEARQQINEIVEASPAAPG